MSGDLHCHTRLSDGSMGIEEIIALAKARGVETIAITDHDCLAGTVRAKIIGERNGVRVITGVELSAIDGETGNFVHILCYLPDSPDRLEGLCHKILVHPGDAFFVGGGCPHALGEGCFVIFSASAAV